MGFKVAKLRNGIKQVDLIVYEIQIIKAHLASEPPNRGRGPSEVVLIAVSNTRDGA